MPQPFKGTSRGDRNVLLQRPELAARIANIAALWAQAELSLGMLFSQLLQTESVVGTAMYLSLISEQARDAAMQAAAQEKLPEQFKAEFVILASSLRSPRKERNAVVHGLWAISDDKPDSLILIDSRKMVKMFSWVHAGNIKPLSESATRYTQAIKDQSESHLEYTIADLVRIENNITAALDRIGAFAMSLEH